MLRIHVVATAVLCALSSCSRDLSTPPEEPPDTTAPSFDTVTADPAHASAGRIVTVAFRASEPLAEGDLNPEVTLGGQPMACAAEDTQYSCTLEVQQAFGEGPKPLVLRGKDRAGNEGVLRPPLTPSVSFDFSQPVLTVTGVNPSYGAGEQVTVLVQSGEPLVGAPRVTFDSALPQAQCVAAQGENAWSCSTTVPLSAAAGVVNVRVEIENLARLVTVDAAKSFSILPAAGALVLDSPVFDPAVGAPGQTQTVRAQANRSLATCSGSFTSPFRTLGGCSVSGDAGTICSCTFVNDGGDGEHPVQLTASETVGGPLVGSGAPVPLVIDGTPPAIDVMQVAIARRPAGQLDQVTVTAAAAADDGGFPYGGRAVRSVRLWASSTGGTALATLPLGGAFELPDSGVSSLPILFISAIDDAGVTGNESQRVALTVGASAGVTCSGAELSFLRGDPATADRVSGTPNGFFSGCALTTFSLVLSDGGVVQSGAFFQDGGFDVALATASPDASYGALDVRGFDKCGAQTSCPVLVGRDLDPANVDGALLTFRRRDAGELDGVEGLPGGITNTCAVTHVEILGEDGGLLARAPVRDGGFAEVAVGTVDFAPPTAVVRAFDKCGRASAATAVRGGAGDGGIQVQASTLQIVRNPVGLVDQVTSLADSIFSVCAPVEARGYPVNDAGVTALFTQRPLAAARIAPVTVGTTTDAPPNVWVNALNKCGQQSPLVELLNGRWATAPAINATPVTVVRNPIGQQDQVVGDAGAIVATSCGLREVLLHDAPTAGTLLNNGALDAGGRFSLAVGTTTFAPPSVFVSATDKCGRTSSRVLVQNGNAGDGGTLLPDAGAMRFIRRDFTTPDVVVSDGGAFTRRVCPPRTVELFPVASGGAPDGSVSLTAAGGFPELPVGDAQRAWPQAWAEGIDKCGLRTPRIEIRNGADLAGPEIDRIFNFSTPMLHHRPDGGDQLYIGDGYVYDDRSRIRVELFAFPDGGGFVAGPFVVTTAGGLDASVGETELSDGYLLATDKTGRQSPLTRVAKLRATVTMGSRTRYQPTPWELAAYPFVSDVNPFDAGPGFGTIFEGETTAAEIANLRAIDTGRVVRTAVTDPSTGPYQCTSFSNAAPPGESGVGATYDYNLKQVIAFGGALADDPAQYFAELYAYDGGSHAWNRIATPGVRPDAGAGFGMAFDMRRGLSVLVGGGLTGSNRRSFHTTWFFDGGTWARGPDLPEGRFQPGVAWDAARRKVVLYGGCSQAGECGASARPASTVHTLDLDGWRQMTVQEEAQERSNMAFGYDPIRDRLVSYGGNERFTMETFTLQELSGVGVSTPTWTEPFQANRPSALSGSRFTYEHGRGLTHFGGRLGNNATDEFHHLESGSWTLIDAGNPPPARSSAVFVHDPGLEKTIVFGEGPGEAYVFGSPDRATYECADRLPRVRYPGMAVAFQSPRSTPVNFRPTAVAAAAKGGFGGINFYAWSWNQGEWVLLDFHGVSPTSSAAQRTLTSIRATASEFERNGLTWLLLVAAEPTGASNPEPSILDVDYLQVEVEYVLP